ncbi:MAG: MerR family transcriptional regulator [Nocardioidaceae bacterium]
MRSGEVADHAGVNRETLRYYERRGLLPEPTRTPGGHRVYSAESVTMLRVIKAAQRLGFTLDEVADLMEASTHRHRTRHRGKGMQDRVAAKLSEVEAKIADLQVIAETLRTAQAAACDDLAECALSPDCPLPFADLAASPR